MNGTAPPDMPLSDIDLGDWRFWVLDDDMRDGAFTTLRREAPISFHAPLETPGVEPGPGHWAVTRFEDVHYASRHPHIFSSSPGITINDANPDVSEFFGSMIAMDDPKQRGLRGIAPPDTRYRGDRGTSATAVAVHPRDQAATGGLDTADLRTCRATPHGCVIPGTGTQ